MRGTRNAPMKPRRDRISQPFANWGDGPVHHAKPAQAGWLGKRTGYSSLKLKESELCVDANNVFAL
jgi:hypothetical protein